MTGVWLDCSALTCILISFIVCKGNRWAACYDHSNSLSWREARWLLFYWQSDPMIKKHTPSTCCCFFFQMIESIQQTRTLGSQSIQDVLFCSPRCVYSHCLWQNHPLPFQIQDSFQSAASHFSCTDRPLSPTFSNADSIKLGTFCSVPILVCSNTLLIVPHWKPATVSIINLIFSS